MGSLYPFDPTVPAVPDIPPISIGALSVGLTDLICKANGLVLPQYATISEATQEFALKFAPGADSAKVITSWAMRFGGVLESHICEQSGQPNRHVTLTFEYFGVSVDAYCYIPLTRWENPS
jgi:hypothetical protein